MRAVKLLLVNWAVMAAMMSVLWFVRRATHDAG